MTHPAPTPSATPPAAPAPLVVAAALAGVEAALLVLFGVAELIAISGARLTMGVTTVLFFVIYGAGLAWCAWRLTRLDSWARAPLVLAQLLQLGVAWSFWGGGSTPVAVGLGLLALLVIAGVFHPASLEALREPREPAA